MLLLYPLPKFLVGDKGYQSLNRHANRVVIAPSEITGLLPGIKDIIRHPIKKKFFFSPDVILETHSSPMGFKKHL